jgi:Tfp pilus assembly protein PilN
MDETVGAVRFGGQSNSLAAVADFISALQTSGWFPQVELVSSQQQTTLVSFTLQGNFLDPEVAAKRKVAAAAAAAAGATAPGAQR